MGTRETVGHGNIFKNLHKKEPIHPDWRGTITVHDAEREITGWWKTGQKNKGLKYISIQIGGLYVKGERAPREDYGNGALFPNRDKKSGDNLPDYKGTVTIHGIKRLMAAWWKKDRNNDDFLSIAVGDVVEDKPGLPAHGG